MTENSEADGEGIERRAVLTALAGATALGSVGTATAQENSSTPTATEEESDTVAIELGSVRIKSWKHTGEEFRITFGADYPSAIKITDTGAMMGAMTEGSGSGITEIPTRGATVKDGMTMTYAAEEFDDAYAIAVASSEAAALIRTDSVDAGSTSIKLQTAMMGGLGAAVGAGGLSYKRGKEALEEDDEPKAERVL
ncbi:hypothetical protein B4589_009515 [Halolamina sp. CBA1230]|uniref:hypothetical protein n=1 Tax=Halolamina sp. CBA1230 TaxID=1853690 RepID=UPI0009A247B0|nr:hypothetical protein [Halolamina sp. CBA1230]QKY20603.1 hypothetical protein B4589_009515 [Halolamina sp. CBA1230]